MSYVEIHKGLHPAWREGENKPEWLCPESEDGTPCDILWDDEEWEWPTDEKVSSWSWTDDVLALRIPDTHWAAPVIAAGMRPWNPERALGQHVEPPADWDRGDVYWASGQTDSAGRWGRSPVWDVGGAYIIGYHVMDTAPASASAPAREPRIVGKMVSPEIADSADDLVKLARMVARPMASRWYTVEQTLAEQILAKIDNANGPKEEPEPPPRRRLRFDAGDTK